MSVSNYLIVKTYFNEYIPNNFNIKKLNEKKYRCIRYFFENINSSYRNAICIPHINDYVSFKLEKTKYIAKYYMFNIITIIIIILIYIFL